jgi:hypothetical protein
MKRLWHVLKVAVWVGCAIVMVVNKDLIAGILLVIWELVEIKHAIRKEAE